MAYSEFFSCAGWREVAALSESKSGREDKNVELSEKRGDLTKGGRSAIKENAHVVAMSLLSDETETAESDRLPSAAHQLSMPDVFIRRARPKPSQVFCTYWWFAYERQNIFYNKIQNPKGPFWTDDATLQLFKFTNAYRASDRVSQFLIRSVQKAHLPGTIDIEETFFRTMLFKLFNKIETWRLLEKSVEEVCWRNYNFKRYNEILSCALQGGNKIYSAAYIMPSPKFGHARKHSNHLVLLEKMMKDKVALQLQQMGGDLSRAFDLIRGYQGIGDFLAYQYVVDLNYGGVLDGSENAFVKAGPGALDGIRKCFPEMGDYTSEDIIRYTCDMQEVAFAELGLHFRSLWGRPLHLIDCQNLFCEVDKYARRHHPEAIGHSNRTRLKQKYRPISRPIEYCYPSQWNLNEKRRGNPGCNNDFPV